MEISGNAEYPWIGFEVYLKMKVKVKLENKKKKVMAGNRLEKIGTIFTRVNGLIRAGALDPAERPLWFDIYKRFPPKDDPVYEKPVPQNKVRKILYPEDAVRSRFYKEFGSPGVIDMTDHSAKPIVERFIDKYMDLLKVVKSDDQAFIQATNSLRAQGVRLQTEEERAKIVNQKLGKQLQDKTDQYKEAIKQKDERKFQANVRNLFGNAASKNDDDDNDGIYMDEMTKTK